MKGLNLGNLGFKNGLLLLNQGVKGGKDYSY